MGEDFLLVMTEKDLVLMLTETEMMPPTVSVTVGRTAQMSVPADALQLKGPGDLPGFRDQQDQKVCKAIQEWRVFQGPKVTREILECRVQGDLKVTEGRWVCQASLASMEYLGTWDLLASLEDLVWMDAMELM